MLRWCALILGGTAVAAGLWLLQYRPSMPGTIFVPQRDGSMVGYANWIILVGGYLAFFGWIVAPVAVPYIVGTAAVAAGIMLTYTWRKTRDRRPG